MKYREIRPGYVVTQVGPLFINIRGNGGYKQPGHPDYEPETFNWHVAPDDEDKAYRRAFASGASETLDAAKLDVEAALGRIIIEMRASLEDS